ncbi:hypothetical protein ACPPVT_00305 [Angustibacter sp. McL0619]|uniref:hypothetical protein n=1 Tax=Angustibacter sp. McL0619 TaxID=3415676 RepID=UPI003CEB4DEB
MNGTLTLVLAFGCLLYAMWVALLMMRDRSVGRVTLALAVALELGFVVQAVLGIVLLATTDRDVPGVLFVAYLLGTVLVLPAAIWWARDEKSKWGTGVLVVAALVDAVLLARLTDIWNGHG